MTGGNIMSGNINRHDVTHNLQDIAHCVCCDINVGEGQA